MRKTYDLVLAAVCAALITVCSWISLNIGDIPFTLQTFGILLVLYSVGGKRGTVSIVVYILLGAVGVPVFSGFKGGPAALAGPTGGFIIGFVVSSLIYWLIDSLWLAKFKKSNTSKLIISVVEGLVFEVVLYIFGVAWFMFVYTRNTGKIGLGAVLSMCVIPFLIPDAVKLAAAAAASLKTSRIVKQ